MIVSQNKGSFLLPDYCICIKTSSRPLKLGLSPVYNSTNLGKVGEKREQISGQNFFAATVFANKSILKFRNLISTIQFYFEPFSNT